MLTDITVQIAVLYM